MNDLVVRTWKRYGNDYLLLLDRQSGDMVGHYDRKTGRLSMREPARQSEAADALRPFMTAADPRGAAAVRPPSPPLDQDPGADLAGAAPGIAAGEPAASRFQRMAARLLGIRTEPAAQQAGAAGERVVGERLEGLRRQGWYVLRSIRLRSGADIGHLAIGPAGVFTVSTKQHPDAQIRVGAQVAQVNGTQYPYLRDCRHEARSAARRLAAAVRFPVDVTPVLAFVGARELRLESAPADVLILRGETIDRRLGALRGVLIKRNQDLIYDVARRADLWSA